VITITDETGIRLSVVVYCAKRGSVHKMAEVDKKKTFKIKHYKSLYVDLPLVLRESHQ
jgi:hypothetical protein